MNKKIASSSNHFLVNNAASVGQRCLSLLRLRNKANKKIKETQQASISKARCLFF